MNIVFTGHRDCEVDTKFLDMVAAEFGTELYTWFHGGATGFDTQVNEYAKYYLIEVITVRPEYDKYHVKVAPLKRDEKMVDLPASLVVAAYDGREEGGTAYTVNYAKSKGIDVLILPTHKI